MRGRRAPRSGGLSFLLRPLILYVGLPPAEQPASAPILSTSPGLDLVLFGEPGGVGTGWDAPARLCHLLPEEGAAALGACLLRLARGSASSRVLHVDLGEAWDPPRLRLSVVRLKPDGVRFAVLLEPA